MYYTLGTQYTCMQLVQTGRQNNTWGLWKNHHACVYIFSCPKQNCKNYYDRAFPWYIGIVPSFSKISDSYIMIYRDTVGCVIKEHRMRV